MIVLLNDFFIFLIYLFIISSMLSIGFGLSLKDITDSLKRKGLLCRSLFLNLILIPFAALLTAYLLSLSGPVLFGFLAMACAPGASYAPRITEVSNGDVGHSTGLMFILCTIAVFSTPFTLMLVLPGANSINPWSVIQTLAIIQMLPLFLGMFLRIKAPKISRKFSEISFWTSNISALIVISVSLYVIFMRESQGGFFSVIIGTFGVLAIIISVLFSFALGFIFGGDTSEEKKSLAISSVNRNAGVAFLIAVSSILMNAQILIMIIIYIIVQSLVSGGFAGFWFWKDYKDGKKTILSKDKK